jgi:hypothetical protein
MQTQAAGRETLQEMVAALKQQLLEEKSRVEALMLEVKGFDDEVWEKKFASSNNAALMAVQRHMHIDVRIKTEKELSSEPTPSGKRLPSVFAYRFKRWNILQLLRRHPDSIEKLPIATLESLRHEGLTVTDRRAVYAHLKNVSEKWKEAAFDETCNDEEAMHKLVWFRGLQYRLKEQMAEYPKHAETLVKVDQLCKKPNGAQSKDQQNDTTPSESTTARLVDMVNYFIHDYGFPVLHGYEQCCVEELSRISNKAQERHLALMQHYDGDFEEIRRAQDCCIEMESIVEVMKHQIQTWSSDSDLSNEGDADKYLEALRSYKLAFIRMHFRSKVLDCKDNESNKCRDPRSLDECILASEVYETFQDLADVVQACVKAIPEKCTNKHTNWSIEVAIKKSYKVLRDLEVWNVTTSNALGGGKRHTTEQNPRKLHVQKLKPSAASKNPCLLAKLKAQSRKLTTEEPMKQSRDASPASVLSLRDPPRQSSGVRHPSK